MGALDELPLFEHNQALAPRIEELADQHSVGSITMVESANDITEQIARKFFAEIQERLRFDIAARKDYHVFDAASAKNKEVRKVGAEWLCLQAVEQLNIGIFLE